MSVSLSKGTLKSIQKRKTSTIAEKKSPVKKKSAEERAKQKELDKIHKEEDMREMCKKEWIDVPFTLSEYTPESFVIVLTPEGNIYSEPVPRYCDFINFINFLSCCKDLPNAKQFSFKADAVNTEFKFGMISTTAFDGDRRFNPYAGCFNLKNSTKAIGGNLIFSKEDGGYKKRELKKVSEWIINELQKEEKIDVD